MLQFFRCPFKDGRGLFPMPRIPGKARREAPRAEPKNAPTAARCGLAGHPWAAGEVWAWPPTPRMNKTLAHFDERLDWVTRRYEQMVAAAEDYFDKRLLNCWNTTGCCGSPDSNLSVPKDGGEERGV